jgi:hypothetical protein
MTDPLRSPERIAACDLRYLRGLVRKAETGFVSVNVNVLRGALDLLTAKAERLALVEAERDAANASRIANRFLRDRAEVTLRQITQAVEEGLAGLDRASFIIERKGDTCVVRRSDAMHALLFVRQTLAAVPGTPEGQ